MADVGNIQNIPLQPAAAQLPAVQKGSYLGHAIRTTYLTARRPYDHVCYWFSGTENPTGILKRIDGAAEQGLQRAKTRGVQFEPVAPRLQADLDAIIQGEKVANAPRIADQAEVGEVANIRPLMPDQEVTRAPQLQQRVDATDWKEEMKVQQERLTNKVSVFTTLLQMRDRCGKKEENNLRLMNLVKNATEGPNPVSVWSLFTTHYNLSFFEWVQAAWFYWVYYQTSLITNTVEAYVGSFIDNMTKDLTKENSATRTLLFRSLLKETNQFLVEDIQAARDFSTGKDHGDLEDYQNRAIERHYGFSLPDLCRKFAERRVDQDAPEVHILQRFQNIPVIGWAFRGFQSMINKFIIQRTMKSWILPFALESGVKKGFEATQPHNLPFTLSLTRFFTGRLEQLEAKLADSVEGPAPAATQFPGTEMLGPTIKNLLLSLELEGLKTPLELRKKFKEIENDSNYGINIEGRIQTSIVESGDLLFRYLNETAQSGELFARLLDLSTAPFSGEAKEQALLEAEFKEEKLKLERTARTVFKTIVHRAVAKTFNGQNSENSQALAEASFKTQEKIARRSIDELGLIADRMALKVEASRLAPSPENSVQPEIAALLQIIQVLANRKELQDRLAAVKGVDQSAIWAALTPLFTRIEEMEKHLLELQELQDHYPSHAAVAQHLLETGDLLRSIKDQFHAEPRHLQNPLIQSLRRAAEEIKRCLGEKSPLHRKLEGQIVEISRLSEKVVKEQQVIDAIQQQLYPPRYPDEVDVQEGLLDKMLNYQRGVHPQGFKPQACLEEIRKCLAHFPENERTELQRIIGNGSDLRSKWTALGLALQRIYSLHLQQKNRDKRELDEILDETSAWVQEKTTKYNIVKGDDYTKMQAEMRAISSGINGLKKEAENMNLNLSISASSNVWGIMRTTGPALAGAALFNYTPGALLGTFLSSGIARWLQGFEVKKSEDPESDSADLTRTVILETMQIGAAASPMIPEWLVPQYVANLGSAALAVMPTAAPLLASAAVAYAGWNLTKGLKTAFDHYAFSKVWNMYDKAYQLTLQPRIYRAATTRLMTALSE